jgi:hypothetical protein
MITRIVLLKLNQTSLETGAFNTLIEASYRCLQAVPGVQNVHVSTGADPACLRIQFRSIDDVAIYQTHPQHVAYVENVLTPATAFKKAWNFEEVAQV